MAGAVILSGRRLANYVEFSKIPPANSVLVPCQVCQREMAISPESIEKAQKKSLETGDRLFVICQPCFLIAVPSGKPTTVEMSRLCAQSIQDEPTSRAMFDRVMSHLRPPKDTT